MSLLLFLLFGLGATHPDTMILLRRSKHSAHVVRFMAQGRLTRITWFWLNVKGGLLAQSRL